MRLSPSTPHCIDVDELSDASDGAVTCDLVSGRSDPVGRVYVSAEHLLSSGDLLSITYMPEHIMYVIDKVAYLFKGKGREV